MGGGGWGGGEEEDRIDAGHIAEPFSSGHEGCSMVKLQECTFFWLNQLIVVTLLLLNELLQRKWKRTYDE